MIFNDPVDHAETFETFSTDYIENNYYDAATTNTQIQAQIVTAIGQEVNNRNMAINTAIAQEVINRNSAIQIAINEAVIEAGIPEAPADNSMYGRRNNTWAQIQQNYLPLAGGTLNGTLNMQQQPITNNTRLHFGSGASFDNSGAGEITFNGTRLKVPQVPQVAEAVTNKAYVDASIQQMTARLLAFNGTGFGFPTKAALVTGPWYYSGNQVTPQNHDVAVVLQDETMSNAQTKYTFQGGVWTFAYLINETPLTQPQWDALNSGVTVNTVAQASGALQRSGGHMTGNIDAGNNQITGVGYIESVQVATQSLWSVDGTNPITVIGTDINFNTMKAIGLGTPTQPNDAATKAYVDNAIQNNGRGPSFNTFTTTLELTNWYATAIVGDAALYLGPPVTWNGQSLQTGSIVRKTS